MGGKEALEMVGGSSQSGGDLGSGQLEAERALTANVEMLGIGILETCFACFRILLRGINYFMHNLCPQKWIVIGMNDWSHLCDNKMVYKSFGMYSNCLECQYKVWKQGAR